MPVIQADVGEIDRLLKLLLKEIAKTAHENAGGSMGEFAVNLNGITLQVIRHIAEVTIDAQREFLEKSEPEPGRRDKG